MVIDTSNVPTPKNTWEFNKGVVDQFDNHVRQSVPGYDVFHSLASSLAEFFVQDDTNVYDLGTSTGEGLKNLAAKFAGAGVQQAHFQVESGVREFHDKLLQDPTLNPGGKVKSVVSLYRIMDKMSKGNHFQL